MVSTSDTISFFILSWQDPIHRLLRAEHTSKVNHLVQSSHFIVGQTEGERREKSRPRSMALLRLELTSLTWQVSKSCSCPHAGHYYLHPRPILHT